MNNNIISKMTTRDLTNTQQKEMNNTDSISMQQNEHNS